LLLLVRSTPTRRKSNCNSLLGPPAQLSAANELSARYVNRNGPTPIHIGSDVVLLELRSLFPQAAAGRESLRAPARSLRGRNQTDVRDSWRLARIRIPRCTPLWVPTLMLASLGPQRRFFSLVAVARHRPRQQFSRRCPAAGSQRRRQEGGTHLVLPEVLAGHRLTGKRFFLKPASRRALVVRVLVVEVLTAASLAPRSLRVPSPLLGPRQGSQPLLGLGCSLDIYG